MRDALLDPSNGFRKSESDDATPDPPLSSDLSEANTAPLAPAAVTINAAPDVPLPADVPLVVMIHVFIDDTRYEPVRQSAVDIPVQSCEVREVLSESGNCEHQIPARVVVSELQKTYSAIEGPAAKLGCPHPLNPTYLQYFARFASSGQLEDSESGPDMLFVSAFSSLFIRVDGISAGASVSCSPAPLKNDSQPDIQCPLEGEVAESSPDQLHRRHPTALSSAVIWLTQRASSRENYQLFINSQHRVLQNSDVILVWRFASEFYDIYHRAKSNTGTRITKAAIQSSLNVGETWLSEALTGHRLVKVYGPGGSNSASEVIQELATERSPPGGRRALLHYLEKWEKDHPITWM